MKSLALLILFLLFVSSWVVVQNPPGSVLSQIEHVHIQENFKMKLSERLNSPLTFDTLWTQEKKDNQLEVYFSYMKELEEATSSHTGTALFKKEDRLWKLQDVSFQDQHILFEDMVIPLPLDHTSLEN